MSDDLSDSRPVRNEQIIRNKNTQAKNGIKKYFHNNKKIKDKPLEFTCECSDINCDKHVKLSIDTYEKLHKRKDRFAVAKGHVTSSVEKVVAKAFRYDVVEKDELNP